MHISRRAELTPPSPIRKLSPYAQMAKEKGLKIYHLNIGQPDIASPPEYFVALKNFSPPVVAYEPSLGNPDLISVWARWLESSCKVKIQEEEILVTVGASEALVFLFMVCADPGDEIIVCEPTYANYLGFAEITGVTLRGVPTDISNGFHIPFEKVREAITPKTRAILICNPNNPTGTVYTDEELKALHQLCEEHDIFLLADETYREYVYDGKKAASVLALFPSSERVAVVDSLSKRFSLCGSRIGVLVSRNRHLLKGAGNVAQARLSVSTVEQYAASAVLKNTSAQFIEAVKEEYERRRNAFLRAFRALPEVEVSSPEGAFYCMCRLKGVRTEEFCKFLLADFSLDNETTFVAPAQGFFITPGKGEDLIRAAFVLEEKELTRAVYILGEGLKAFREKSRVPSRTVANLAV